MSQMDLKKILDERGINPNVAGSIPSGRTRKTAGQSLSFKVLACSFLEMLVNSTDKNQQIQRFTALHLAGCLTTCKGVKDAMAEKLKARNANG